MDNNRNIDHKQFPVKGKMNEKLGFLLHYAVLSPSVNNSQPWKFRINETKLIITPDYSRIRAKVDPKNREIFITLGAAAKNVELAANYFGLVYKKTIEEDRIIYRFDENEEAPRVDEDLFKAITKRRTEKGDFRNEGVEGVKLQLLKNVGNEKTWVTFFDDGETKEKVGKLVYEADLVWFKSRDLINELERWLRDDVENAKDGLPTGIISMYKIAAETKYLFSKNSQAAMDKAEKDRQMVQLAPILALVVSQKDEINDWIEAGSVYETLALKLTALGLGNGLFNNVIELNGQRRKLMKELSLDGHAQMLLRIGYTKPAVTITQRRPIEEVLVK